MKPADHLPLRPRDFLILVVLADGPLHGYGILKAVEEQAGLVVPLDPANLYRSLKRMRRDGIVEEAEPAQGVVSPEQRRYFTLTELGSTVLAAEAARLSRLTAIPQVVRLLEKGEAALG